MARTTKGDKRGGILLSRQAELATAILIVDDDRDMRALLRSTLRHEGYPVVGASTGNDGLALALRQPPLLVVLDRHLPDIPGLEVLNQLRSERSTRDVLVVLVTCMNNPEDRLAGYLAGADGYIAKPFTQEALRAQVAGLLRRHLSDRGLDPLTKLPGNVMLRNELAARLSLQDPFAVLYADLSHFKPYVDRYGVEAAAHVLDTLTEILLAAVARTGSPKDFVGHIGGDDFLVLTSSDSVDDVTEDIVFEFEARVPEFYDAADLEHGYFDGRDRYFVRRRFSLMSVDVAAVDVGAGDFNSTDELGRHLARCKTVTKRSGKRWCRFDRAGNHPRRAVREIGS